MVKGCDIVANEQNLKPGEYKLSVEEAKKGGINSGIARRQKATMKETLKQMLEEVADIEGNDSKLTYRQLATLGLIKGSIQCKADNYKTILEAIGELSNEVKITPEININVVDNEDLEKAMYKKE
jgi:23S rRNA A2030 N6-methylase RlmJ